MSAEKIVDCEFFEGEESTCSKCSKPIQEHKGMILDSILITREQLEAIQWRGRCSPQGDSRCPACRKNLDDGHANDCWIGQKLTNFSGLKGE